MQEVIWCSIGSWEPHCARRQMKFRQKEKSPRKKKNARGLWTRKKSIVTIYFSVTTASDNKCPTNLDCFIVDEGVNCFVASFWICLVHDHPKLGPESIQQEHQGLPFRKACMLLNFIHLLFVFSYETGSRNCLCLKWSALEQTIILYLEKKTEKKRRWKKSHIVCMCDCFELRWTGLKVSTDPAVHDH